MTIEEAILHAEEVATEQERLMARYDAASGYARSGNEAIRTESAKKCEQCAAEHRQLAEWLRELAERREAPEIVHCGECRHNGTRNCMLNLWATIFNSKPKDDFFCGMAERRTE